MRIGIFTECYKPIINGVVNSIIGFKRGLEELGHEVYVFCPTYKGYKNDPDDKNIIHLRSIPLPGKSGYHFIFPVEKNIKDIANTMDLIHVQHPFIMGKRAADIAEEFSLPLVFTNHTQYEQYAHYIPISKGMVNRSIQWYIRRFTKRVNLIVAPAPGIVKILERYGVKTPIEVVPNGIDVARFEKKVLDEEISKLHQKYNLNPNNKILVFTGRIGEEKNLTFLLKAFQKINTKNPNVYLIMVGGGVQIEHFKNLIKELKLDGRAIITDYIPYSQMQNYLALGYIYVTASKSEVHPLTILEGLAAGMPMVIVDAPGTGDIVTDGVDGLVAKDNIDDYADKVEKLLSDKKLYDRLSAGAKKTAQKYSFLESSKTMLKAYEKAIEIHRSKLVNK